MVTELIQDFKLLFVFVHTNGKIERGQVNFCISGLAEHNIHSKELLSDQETTGTWKGVPTVSCNGSRWVSC